MQSRTKIVLVEPEHPGNIGAVARAMKTMGFHQLYLVKPKRFPDPQTDWRAANAIDIIDDACVCETVAEAVAGCDLVVGTTARTRHIPWPSKSLAEFAEDAVRDTSNISTAILFGRETNGLSNDELDQCNLFVTIPTASEYSSLNLAMAVQLVTYELHKCLAGAPADATWDKRLATNQEVSEMLEQLDSVCSQIGFFGPKSPRHGFTRLTRMFRRTALDETEVNLLRGFLSRVQVVAPSTESAIGTD